MRPHLGINLDHVATLRQLRGTPYPDLIEAARLVEKAGADQITVHLREDRRHIQDSDVRALRTHLLESHSSMLLNLEMAGTSAMVRFALQVKPDWICLVPEKRKELTTEGGLDLSKNQKFLAKAIQQLKEAGIKVSCFIEPSTQAVKLSKKLGSDAVEFHTGQFCLETQKDPGSRSEKKIEKELERLKKAASLARLLGLNAHAGHGLDYENVRRVAQLRDQFGAALIEEYNIGHSIVCRAVLVGLELAVSEMVTAIL